MDVDWDHELPADKTCRYLENLSHTQVAHDWPYLAPEVRRRQIEDFASRNADGIKRSRVGFSDARNQLGSLCHRSEEHTSELQSLMRLSYSVFCLKQKNKSNISSRRTNIQD